MSTKTVPLPASSLAADTAWLKSALQQNIFNEHHLQGEIASVELMHLWKSSKRITFLYEVIFREQNEEPFSQLYIGYRVAGENLSHEYQSVLKKGKVPPRYGPPVMLFPEANLVLSAFPNDRKMRLFSNEDFGQWLHENLPKIIRGKTNGAQWQVEKTRLEVLRYVPSKRFTTRCSATLVASDGREQKICLIAKQLSEKKKARRLYRNLESLCKAWKHLKNGKGAVPQAEVGQEAAVRVPRPLFLYEPKSLVFIEEIPGKNLKQALPEIELAEMMPRVGRLLALFHQARKRVRKRVTRNNEMAEIREALGIIRQAFPEMKPRLRELFARINALQWQDEVDRVLLHGSYRLNHIFLHGSELALLDLDSLRVGHPAYDIANFLSSLYYLDAQKRFSGETRQTISNYFLQGYESASPWKVSPQSVLWFLASLLINKQAFKYVNHGHADRREKVKRMLGLAEAAISKCEQVQPGMGLADLGPVLP